MSAAQLGLWGLGLYLLVLFVVGVIARRARRADTPADHFLAGRDLGVFVLFLTLYATTYSGNSLLGYPGEAYRRGFSFVMATGFMMSIIVCFHILVPRLRPVAVRRRFVTPGDWVRHRFGGERLGPALVIAVSILMSIALGNFLFAQLKAMGEMAEQVTGGLVPYEAGVIALALMILFYETLGGMRAVAWTDAAQGILMLLGLAEQPARARVRAEAVPHPVARSDEALHHRDRTQARHEQVEGDDDRHHEAGRHDPGEAAPVRLARVADQRVSAVGGRVEREEEHQHAELAPCEEVIRGRVLAPRPPRNLRHDHERDQIDEQRPDADLVQRHRDSSRGSSGTSVRSQATVLSSATPT